jgi:putative ABC transport system permease protein
MQTIKNVFRRKMRAFLTIFGIVIGILALVLMGSIAEKLTLLVDGGTNYYSDKVTVAEASNLIASFGANPMSIDKLEEIRKIDGVREASGNISMMLDDEMNAVSMGMPDTIIGSDLKGEEYESFRTTYASGRKLQLGDEGKVVIGSDLVKKLNASVGEKVYIKGQEFEVVGILEKTLTAPDTSVSMLLSDSQKLFINTLPEAIRSQVDADKLITSITVYPKEGVGPDILAEKINTEVDGVKATGPAGFRESVAEPLKPFNAIIFGVALISLIVGGLSIINTMSMSVSERTREIGIRKAIGASDRQIIKQFVTEAALIGFILNTAGAENNMSVFLLTPRLAIGSLVFAVFIGVISGLYPAWYASRLDPVKALRYE